MNVMTDIAGSLTTDIARIYTELGTDARGPYKAQLRLELAEATGCTPIGRGSCYAAMVAVPKDYPNIVVKICTLGDAFITYANAILDGSLVKYMSRHEAEDVSQHFLKVYSGTQIDNGVWLYVIERLEDMEVNAGFHTVEYCEAVLLESVENASRIAAFHCGADRDRHSGNMMVRIVDGVRIPVWIDPIC